jgi:UDP-glucose 4-epimerase
LVERSREVARYFVTGGAGFIGSHLVHRLLEAPDNEVVVYDDAPPERCWRLPPSGEVPRLRLVRGDLKDLARLTATLPTGTDAVVHLASNPDIARAASQPDIDFWEGTYLTQNLLEAMRIKGVSRIVYSSGSGVYGDTGDVPVAEDDPPRPISTYGASKLACEAMMRAYAHLFGIHGLAFRFANVVGPRQTHGVAYDFVRRLRRDPSRLRILGDGHQSKSYVHVEDVLSAILLVLEQGWNGFEAYNLAPDDTVTVRRIADLCVAAVVGAPVEYEFAGGDRGWKGDVPVVRFDTSRLRARGWQPRRNSTEALTHAIASLLDDDRAGRFENDR